MNQLPERYILYIPGAREYTFHQLYRKLTTSKKKKKGRKKRKNNNYFDIRTIFTNLLIIWGKKKIQITILSTTWYHVIDIFHMWIYTYIYIKKLSKRNVHTYKIE